MAIQTLQEITRQHLTEASQAALAKFRDAVRPIYGVTDKGDPDHIGSAVLLHLAEGYFLLTAAHVLDANAYTKLYLGADDFQLLQGEVMKTKAPDEDRNKDFADFSIMRLDADLVAKLSRAKFITQEEINYSVASTEGRTYTILGYPNSKNKPNRHKGTKVKPVIGRYTGQGRAASQLPNIATEDDHILVDHDEKYSKDEAGVKVHSIVLKGFSGGAIIDLGRFSVEALSSTPSPKLAALVIEAHSKEKVILGIKITTVLSSIRKYLGDAALTHTPPPPAGSSTPPSSSAPPSR
jgi:hypothetical protein